VSLKDSVGLFPSVVGGLMRNERASKFCSHKPAGRLRLGRTSGCRLVQLSAQAGPPSTVSSMSDLWRYWRIQCERITTKGNWRFKNLWGWWL